MNPVGLPGTFNSAIHKAAGSLVTGHSLQNGKMSMGNRRTERPPDPVLYGGRPSGGFVNRAVKPPMIISATLQQEIRRNLLSRKSNHAVSNTWLPLFWTDKIP